MMMEGRTSDVDGGAGLAVGDGQPRRHQRPDVALQLQTEVLAQHVNDLRHQALFIYFKCQNHSKPNNEHQHQIKEQGRDIDGNA